jgi:hypothetical protein
MVSETAVPSVPIREKLPFLTADGTLSIPFDSPERYHWWKPDGERLSIAETREEVRSRRSQTRREVSDAVAV